MADELRGKINSAFWSRFHANFGKDQLDSMQRIRKNEKGEEIYWLCFHGMAYIASVLNGKLLGVGREKC